MIPVKCVINALLIHVSGFGEINTHTQSNTIEISGFVLHILTVKVKMFISFIITYLLFVLRRTTNCKIKFVQCNDNFHHFFFVYHCTLR